MPCPSYQTPYSAIKCVTTGKILRHMMDPNVEMNRDVAGVLRKAKTEWRATRNKIKRYQEAESRIRITHRDSLVGSVLRYGTHVTPLSQTQLTKPQPFYSGCIGRLVQNSFTELDQKSPMHFLYVANKTYHHCKKTQILPV